MTNPKPNTPAAELREQLAAIEHERWADWQRYLHSKLDEMPIGWRMSASDHEHWERQINTPYSELSEKEKDSDREQVDRYWKLIDSYHQQPQPINEKESEKLKCAKCWRPPEWFYQNQYFCSSHYQSTKEDKSNE